MTFGLWLQHGIERAVNGYRMWRWQDGERLRNLSRGWSLADLVVSTIVMVIVIQLYLVQLYVIPSGSMETTLLIGDKVAVNKWVFGPELVPGGLKQGPTRPLRRAEVVAFVSPDGPPPSVAYSSVQRVVFLLTLGLLDLDRFRKVLLEGEGWRSLRPERSPASRRAIARLQGRDLEPELGATPLLVKRAVGLGGDTLRFIDGNLELRPEGQSSFLPEEDFRTLAGLDYQHRRDQRLQGRERSYLQRVMLSYHLNPHDPLLNQRFWHEVLGHYVPRGSFLPLGDNRDNSHDGRWFGLVAEQKLIGKIIFRFWPLSRLHIF